MPVTPQAPVEPKSTEEDVAEVLDGQDEGTQDGDESSSEALGTDAEADASDAAEDSSTQTKKDGESDEEGSTEGEAETDAMDEFIPKVDPKKEKDHVQKRIDQLTAQLKELKAENLKLKDPKETQASKEPEYTDAQLKGAMKKAMEEGDSELVMEIMEYKVKKAQKDLISMYEKAQTEAGTRQAAINQEWKKVSTDYSTAWADDSGKEMYPGAKNELNIGDSSSLLYRLALKFYYESKDENGNPIYHTQGGQRMAVADAYNTILKKRKLSPGLNEKKKLERSLAKAKRKTAIPSSHSSDSDTPRKSRNEADKLAEYMAERKSFLNERK